MKKQLKSLVVSNTTLSLGDYSPTRKTLIGSFIGTLGIFMLQLILLLLFVSPSQAQEKFGPPVDNFSNSAGDCEFEGECAYRSKPGRQYHQGTDHGGSYGTPIYSIGDGRICKINDSYTGCHLMGKLIVIEHTLTTGKNIYSMYAHLDQIYIRAGDLVKKGQKIAGMGASGGCASKCGCRNGWGDNNVHLHFEIKDACVFRSPHNNGKAPGHAGYSTNSPPSQLGFHNPRKIINSSRYLFKSSGSGGGQSGPPMAPQLIRPSGSNIGTPVQFEWQKIPGAEYRIVIGTSNRTSSTKGFGSGVQKSINTGTRNTFSWDGARAGTTYYWTVRAFINGRGVSKYTSAKSFKTRQASSGGGGQSGPLVAPQLFRPSGSNIGTPVQFEWQKIPGAEYRIVIGTSNRTSSTKGFGSGVQKSINTGTRNTFSWDGARAGTTYYWTVRAFINGRGVSKYTSAKSFKTRQASSGGGGQSGPPAAPQLIRPSGSNIGTPVQFEWKKIPGAEYRIVIGTSNRTSSTKGFGSGVQKSMNTGTRNTFSWDGARAGTTYYWTVRAFINGRGVSKYTSAKSFKTRQASSGGGGQSGPPAAPQLIRPSGSNIGTPVQFEWKKIPGAEYRIVIGTSNRTSSTKGFRSGVQKSMNTGTRNTFSWDGARAGTTYYWTVRAFINGRGVSKYTSAKSFKTRQASSGGGASGGSSTKISITSPSRSARLVAGNRISIRWSVRSNDPMKIDLYKSNRIVNTIIRSTRNDGSHSWTIPSSLSTGNYHIQITNTRNSRMAGTSSFTITGRNSSGGGSGSSGNGGSTRESITVKSLSSSSIYRGRTYSIRWSDNISDYVKIELYDGSRLVKRITSKTRSDGSFNWKIPRTLKTGTRYRIKITSTRNSRTTDFGSYFRIK